MIEELKEQFKCQQLEVPWARERQHKNMNERVMKTYSY